MTLCKQAVEAPDCERWAASFCGGRKWTWEGRGHQQVKVPEENAGGTPVSTFGSVSGMEGVLPEMCRCLYAMHEATYLF